MFYLEKLNRDFYVQGLSVNFRVFYLKSLNRDFYVQGLSVDFSGIWN